MKNLISLLTTQCNLHVEERKNALDVFKSIPLAIKSFYHLHVLKIEHLDCLVLETNEPSVRALKKHLLLFGSSVPMPIILYVPNLSGSMRRYLLENNIAYATKENFYMPQLLIHLKDMAHKIAPIKKQEKLSKLAQMIVSYALVTRTYELEIDTCASQFEVTKMSAGRALNELKAFHMVSLKERGRKKIYILSSSLEFESFICMLKNPKHTTVYLNKNSLHVLQSYVEASYMALSHYANIITTQASYAIDKETFQTLSKQHALYFTEEAYDSDFCALELWNFNPGLIQKGYIDPLSLYLSLKDDIDTEDTRVADAFTTLEEIIKGFIRDSRDR